MCYIAYIKKSLRGRSMFDVDSYHLFNKEDFSVESAKEARERGCVTLSNHFFDEWTNDLKAGISSKEKATLNSSSTLFQIPNYKSSGSSINLII